MFQKAKQKVRLYEQNKIPLSVLMSQHLSKESSVSEANKE